MADYPLYEIRRRNLARLLTQTGAKTELATRMEMKPANVSHWLRAPGERGSRDIREETARKIEEAMRLPSGELDKDLGPESKSAIKVAAPERKRPNGVEPMRPERVVNHELMARTIRVVLNEVQSVKGKPMNEKVAEIATLAYEQASDFGELDETYVQKLVKLMT